MPAPVLGSLIPTVIGRGRLSGPHDEGTGFQAAVDSHRLLAEPSDALLVAPYAWEKGDLPERRPVGRRRGGSRGRRRP